MSLYISPDICKDWDEITKSVKNGLLRLGHDIPITAYDYKTDLEIKAENNKKLKNSIT